MIVIENKTVMITGSSRGIGKGLVLVFSKNGYNVVIHGRDKERLERVNKKVEKNNVKCTVITGDINSVDVLNRLSDVAAENDVSILINNAGLPCPHLPLDEIKDEQVDDIINTNLISPIKLTSRIYQQFVKKQSGTIININSLSGLENHFKRTIYCTSRWGERGFTDTLRKEAEENNVRVFGVYLSRTKTQPEYAYGMTVEYVTQKIFEFYESNETGDLTLDNRPKKVSKCV